MVDQVHGCVGLVVRAESVVQDLAQNLDRLHLLRGKGSGLGIRVRSQG
jgi:hypothetical protein